MAEKMYRYGVNHDCPVHGVTIAGLCFPRKTEKVEGYGADTKRSEVEGMISILEESKFNEVIDAAQYKFVRGTKGKRARHWIVDSRTRGFRSQPDDKPIADFIYMHEIVERENPFAKKMHKTISAASAPKAQKVAARKK